MIPKAHSAKYSNYHFCIVRECKNTSINSPGKLWIKVPSDLNTRNSWLTLAKRDPKTLSTSACHYFCEDHFDLKEDMENYMQYKIMGSVKQIRMKTGCIPSRFDCQKIIKHKTILKEDCEVEDEKKARHVTKLSHQNDGQRNSDGTPPNKKARRIHKIAGEAKKSNSTPGPSVAYNSAEVEMDIEPQLPRYVMHKQCLSLDSSDETGEVPSKTGDLTSASYHSDSTVSAIDEFEGDNDSEDDLSKDQSQKYDVEPKNSATAKGRLEFDMTNICRCCLNEEGVYDLMDKCFFVDLGEDKVMFNLLLEFGIRLNVSGDRSKLICQRCKILLVQAHHFRKTALEVEAKFNSLYAKTRERKNKKKGRPQSITLKRPANTFIIGFNHSKKQQIKKQCYNKKVHEIKRIRNSTGTRTSKRLAAKYYLNEQNVNTGEMNEHDVRTGEMNEHNVSTGEMNEHIVSTGEMNEHNISTGEMNEHDVSTGEKNEHYVKKMKKDAKTIQIKTENMCYDVTVMDECVVYDMVETNDTYCSIDTEELKERIKKHMSESVQSTSFEPVDIKQEIEHET